MQVSVCCGGVVWWLNLDILLSSSWPLDIVVVTHSGKEIDFSRSKYNAFTTLRSYLSAQTIKNCKGICVRFETRSQSAVRSCVNDSPCCLLLLIRASKSRSLISIFQTWLSDCESSVGIVRPKWLVLKVSAANCTQNEKKKKKILVV